MKTKLFLNCLVVLGLVTLVGMAASAQDGAIRSILALPYLDAAYIARLPRYDHDAAKNQSSAGDAVTFQASIANRGSQNTGPFSYAWYVDNNPSFSNTHSSLDPGETATLSLGWTWQTGSHFIRSVNKQFCSAIKWYEVRYDPLTPMLCGLIKSKDGETKHVWTISFLHLHPR